VRHDDQRQALADQRRADGDRLGAQANPHRRGRGVGRIPDPHLHRRIFGAWLLQHHEAGVGGQGGRGGRQQGGGEYGGDERAHGGSPGIARSFGAPL